MRLRAPAYPLITVDPYFSVWSAADKLTDKNTEHWTGKPHKIIGTAVIDGNEYRFMGEGEDTPAMDQVSVDVSAFSTKYVFEKGGVRLTLTFTTPLIPSDLKIMTRPVSYLEIQNQSIDRKKHSVKVKIAVSEELCVNLLGEDKVEAQEITLSDSTLSCMKMGSLSQKMLERDGDDLRIEWGYFYLTSKGTVGQYENNGELFVFTEVEMAQKTLLTFAYDDIYSIQYFGKNLKSYWNKDGALITDEIVNAFGDYNKVMKRCAEMADRLFIDATRAGGEKYAELLELAFRQAIAAHKVAIDEDGEILFVSKECFSNGCAATVDVSYPSIPMFLIYNPELVKGMMRPIYKYEASDVWQWDFAPHDAGRYPRLDRQRYGLKEEKYLFEKQMPVEECGNMLVMAAAAALASGDTKMAKDNLDLLEAWVKYLFENGRDPENQLCTDDFAGHLAHNCNLSLKAISGIISLGVIYKLLGDEEKFEEYKARAREMALDWIERAANEDGSFRLTFDGEG
ncbi:MAG: DUF4965 domain-containing protein, partial [Clostridia bacterium]|nr:DUF4965 domain-containing protein [Clostridia bacterium]